MTKSVLFFIAVFHSMLCCGQDYGIELNVSYGYPYHLIKDELKSSTNDLWHHSYNYRIGSLIGFRYKRVTLCIGYENESKNLWIHSGNSRKVHQYLYVDKVPIFFRINLLKNDKVRLNLGAGWSINEARGLKRMLVDNSKSQVIDSHKVVPYQTAVSFFIRPSVEINLYRRFIYASLEPFFDLKISQEIPNLKDVAQITCLPCSAVLSPGIQYQRVHQNLHTLGILGGISFKFDNWLNPPKENQ